MQPLGQYRAQAGVVDAQQLTHARPRCSRFAGSRRGCTEKGQLGRWHIVGKGAQGFQARHLQGAQALAQGAFQRCFPTRLDMDTGPQALQAVEPVLGQPGRELAVGLDAFLQGLESIDAG